ncbi:peptidoglycan-binding domain-containing protein [Flavobacterium sp. KACC 22761]|uniref:peptidoglycan-binding domain-containing protein n=1 Tax=Flavobacterium sp. KACC 22761 TaxID=3092665 RepID=UPI002A75B35A|nr:peptidoglycan-binding domain-containing protein [Flavobacterium sp. KACC 22761]WPO77928.1 peptidoglycan-binding domain-containing protein [Flavobacterium sp. KACC 22761]
MENIVSNTTANQNIANMSGILRSSVGLNATNNASDVILIQNYLKALGYPLQSNGYIANSQTDSTVISIFNFQANNNLPITGNVNPDDACFNTLKQLNRGNASITESEDESLHQPFLTNSFLFRRNAGNANTLNVIFEGDSWLDYPVPTILDLYDTITDRNQRLNLNCLHLAKFGETTSQMYADRTHFVQYVSGYRIDRIYFSGGGNDVFPQLGRIVNAGVTSFDPSFFTDQAKLTELRSLSGDDLYQKCIVHKRFLNTNTFDRALFNSVNLSSIFSTIMRNYLGFGNIVNTYATPNTIFYMHTYDYPLFKLGVRPSIVGVDLPLGPWIKPVFDRLGIADEILRSYIIIRLLDKFYALLCQIKNHFNYYGYRFQSRIIDYRGLLNSSEYWRDEIHPNSAGARRLATRVTF